MTRSELKHYQEEYARRSQFLKDSSLERIMGVQESAEEQQMRVARLLKPGNYNDLCRYWFPELCPADCAPAHLKMYLELHGMPRINQFIHAYRGFAKSVHAVVLNSFALKQLGMLKFKLIIGINEDRARLLLADLQMELESNQSILRDFGNQMVYGKWEDGEFQTADGCFFKAVSITQPFRGLRFGAYRLTDVTVDDCEDAQVAENERRVRNRINKITKDLNPAFAKGVKRIQICNNYFIDNGLIAGLHKKWDDSPFTRTHTINLSTGTPDEPGAPTWPAYFPEEEIEAIHQDNDIYALSTEYYNTPVREGKKIREEWLKYPPLPKGVIPDIAVGYWDLSYVKDGDYKAMALIGGYKMKLYLVEIYCAKVEITVAIDHHFDRAKHYKKLKWNVLWYYDATAAQKAVFNPLFLQASMRHQFPGIPIPDSIPGVDKILRIEATLVNVFFNGMLVICIEVTRHPHWEQAKFQLLAVEKGSKVHDDFPDVLERAVSKAQIYLSEAGSGGFEVEPIMGEYEIGGF